MKDEFHPSGLTGALKFWGGVIICFIAIFLNGIWWLTIIGVILWLVGAFLIIKQIIRNYKEYKGEAKNKTLSMFNMIIKIAFLVILLILIIVMNV